MGKGVDKNPTPLVSTCKLWSGLWPGPSYVLCSSMGTGITI